MNKLQKYKVSTNSLRRFVDTGNGGKTFGRKEEMFKTEKKVEQTFEINIIQSG